MDYEKKAVGHTQDWSDPKRALEEIERATAAREQLATGNGWFDKLVKRTPEAPPPEPKPPRRKASATRRAARKS